MTADALIGVDIGGTFTDVVLVRAGRPPLLGKHLTTHDDPSRGVVAGVADVLARGEVDPGRVSRVAHATTLATNTILERRGVDVAFVTTAGFRDMLTLGRGARVEEQRFDLMFDAPVPPIPPHRCFEVRGRMGHDGNEIVPLDEEDVTRVAAALADTSVAAVAVSFLHSYANPKHEVRAAELLTDALPGRTVVASSTVWPEMREYERSTTTLMSAYVGPVMDSYLRDLSERLAQVGVTAPLHVMESSGGLMSARLAAARAVYTIESGPAAGVMAARDVGVRAGIADLISFDMGGTTAKAGVIRSGRAEITRSFHVGGSGSFGGRREGSGIPIKAPAIDLAEVGSGGGSVAWIDDGEALRVGPRSAGSEPGPACYGLGGTEPTVTDANLVLGYLDPEGFAGGRMPLSVARAQDALGAIARRLGVEVLEAAHAVHEIANANMGSAVHVVTVQRGVDPRGFTLVGFGGAGPMHAARIAERFDIRRVVVPPGCGVASAIGLLTTDMVVERARTMLAPVSGVNIDAARAVLDDLANSACDDLELHLDEVELEWAADLRFLGQAHELTVDLPSGVLDRAALTGLEERFAQRYAEAYGATSLGAVELVGWRVRVIRRVGKIDLVAPDAGPSHGHASRSRLAYVHGRGLVEVPVWHRDALGAATIEGPAIVEEPEATTVVPEGWVARCTPTGCLELRRGDRAPNHLSLSND